MSDSTMDGLRRLEAELRGLPEDLPTLTLLAALPVPLPTLPFATVETAPAWVAKRVDGCTGSWCMAHIAPTLWAVDGDTLVAAYYCRRCREAWWTSWSVPPVWDWVAA